MNKPIKRIYFITFHLCLGILLLGMPQAYGTSQDSLKKIPLDLFKKAMETYQNQNLSKKSYQHRALKEIKSCVALSPKAYECMVGCYMRYHFDKADNNMVYKQLIPIISDFIKQREDESYYQQRRTGIIQWGFYYRCFTFCADCLEAEAIYIRLCNIQGIRPVDILPGDAHYAKRPLEDTRYDMYGFYTHGKNFLKHELLLWLMNIRGWPVPTNENIVKLNSINHRKKLRYIQLLCKGELEFLKDLADTIL